jgi:chorismate--pyruvate lyase
MTKSPHNRFPVTLPATWLALADCDFSPTLKSWLTDKNSLTARLKENSDSFRVELLGQCIEVCTKEEANNVITAGEEVLVREVVLFCNNEPHVFARSLIPLSSLTGEEKALANLGTQPLGQVLFNNPSLSRESIEFARFNEASSVSKLCHSLGFMVADDLWGRRSTFTLENKPLLVAEVFLPSALVYQ